MSFEKIGNESDLDEYGQFSKWIGGHDILVYKLNNNIKALSNICPHFGGPIGFHKMKDNKFTCLWHNLEFDAENGRCLEYNMKLREYPVKILDGDIYVQIHLER